MKKIIDGQQIARDWQWQIECRIQSAKLNRSPTLAVILVGNNPASHLYVSKKTMACESVGIHSLIKSFDSDVDQAEILRCIEQLNNDNGVDGILVQLPLPKHLDPLVVTNHVAPTKDVDGLHALSIGRLAQKYPGGFRCCTPKGIMHALKILNIDLVGKQAVVVGQSNIVGRPMMLELLNAGATVCVCHKHTKNLNQQVRQAEIIIVGAGHPHLLGHQAIASDSIVFDVGTTLVGGKLLGDVNFDEAINQVRYITPVPGGVGPLTIAALLDNTVLAFEALN